MHTVEPSLGVAVLQQDLTISWEGVSQASLDFKARGGYVEPTLPPGGKVMG